MSSKKAEVAQLLSRANSALQQGQPQVAGPLLQAVLQRDPKNLDAAEQLGLAAYQTQQTPLAENCWKEILRVDPRRIRSRYMLACLYGEQRQDDLAVQHYEHLLALKPGMIEAHNNLGVIYKNREQYAKAATCFKKVVAKSPKSAFALSNLGNVLKEGGQFEEAVKVLERAVEADPTLSAVYSNMLVSLNYRDDWSAQEIFERHQRWSEHLPETIKPERFDFPADWAACFKKGAEATRKLRVGFVSPDLHRHSVAFFVSPLLQHLDAAQFDSVVYYTNTIFDDVQRALQANVSEWHNVEALSDHQLADQIYQDKIDVLIDLAGHTANNRLAVLAQKPSPVQMTWLGYPNTTGLSQIDYRITDEIADPVATSQSFYTESLAYPGKSFLCFEPSVEAPDVSDSPCLNKGYLTFGSFNNLAKVSPEVIADWAELLSSVPHSRLLIKSRQLADLDTKESMIEQFRLRGIGPDRLDLVEFIPGDKGHLGAYSNIDIALDTYPYNGTTTTCEALWMGVPVLARKGSTHASRVGESLLVTVGLADYVCQDLEAMKGQALAWDADHQSLNGLRQSIRVKMKQSDLCDAQGFAQRFGDLLLGCVQAKG